MPQFIKKFPFVKETGIAKKLRDGYIWYEFYYGNGMSIYDKIKQPTMVFGALTAITYFNLIPQSVLYLFIPLWFIGWVVAGYFWFTIFKIPQRRSIIGVKRMSPIEKTQILWLKRILYELNKKYPPEEFDRKLVEYMDEMKEHE